MILKCDCENSTLDALYGKGRRSHVELATGEYLCVSCYYVRTAAQGMRTGQKTRSAGFEEWDGRRNSQATPRGFQVEGWIEAQPSRKTRENNRHLRARRCKPPRLTTKVADPPIREGRRVRSRAA